MTQVPGSKTRLPHISSTRPLSSTRWLSVIRLKSRSLGRGNMAKGYVVKPAQPKFKGKTRMLEVDRLIRMTSSLIEMCVRVLHKKGEIQV